VNGVFTFSPKPFSYSYLMENGFTLYGAFVIGPVKELLKLKEVERIHGANLGKMTYWNWSE
jgi:hypothetical protein